MERLKQDFLDIKLFSIFNEGLYKEMKAVSFNIQNEKLKVSLEIVEDLMQRNKARGRELSHTQNALCYVVKGLYNMKLYCLFQQDGNISRAIECFKIAQKYVGKERVSEQRKQETTIELNILIAAALILNRDMNEAMACLQDISYITKMEFHAEDLQPILIFIKTAK